MNAFISILKKHDLEKSDCLSRSRLSTLQVNMGNLCNQRCRHCHIEGSPEGKNVMTKKIVDDVLGFLSRYKMHTLDITGGAPEMNPNFTYFIKKARSLVDDLIVRTNLTVLMKKNKLAFCRLYKELKVHLICSLPCYLEKNVNSQRGNNVYKKSIAVLQELNKQGFGIAPELCLDLVYNPAGATLPPSQLELEKDYKRELKGAHGINFNRLITIANVPIKRFKSLLEASGEYDHYCQLLKDNFNPDTLCNIMCRTFLSVGHDGKLYDCDFNQALGLAIKTQEGDFLKIDKLNPQALIGQEILLGEHCFSCTAGRGSSCQGALAA